MPLATRRLGLITSATALLTSVVAGAAYSVQTATEEPQITTSTPRSERQLTNIDILKQQIRNYYGDPLDTGIIGADSNYVREVRSAIRDAERWLSHSGRRPSEPTRPQAIVLDIDDTTLTTWNLVVASNWNGDSPLRADYVDNQKFVAVPGMVDFVNAAQQRGYTIFYISNRRISSTKASLGNLTSDGIGVDAGFPAPGTLPNGEAGLFMRPKLKDYPSYLKQACANDPDLTCTPTHLKTAYRARIESFGYDIVANLGDQQSDLDGGYADRTFKLPNPNGYTK